MQTFLSQNTYRRLVKSSSKYVSFIKLDSILLMKWLPLLVTNTLISSRLDYCNSDCLEVCPILISSSCRVFRKLLHVLSQIIQSMLMPHPSKSDYWLPVSYPCIFKNATLVYKFLHIGSPSYIELSLSQSSCSYSRYGHLDC